MVRDGYGKKAQEVVFDRNIFNTNCICVKVGVVEMVCRKIGILAMGVVVILVSVADIVLVKKNSIE